MPSQDENYGRAELAIRALVLPDVEDAELTPEMQELLDFANKKR